MIQHVCDLCGKVMEPKDMVNGAPLHIKIDGDVENIWGDMKRYYFTPTPTTKQPPHTPFYVTTTTSTSTAAPVGYSHSYGSSSGSGPTPQMTAIAIRENVEVCLECYQTVKGIFESLKETLKRLRILRGG